MYMYVYIYIIGDTAPPPRGHRPPNIESDRTNQQDSGQISVDRSTTDYSQHLQSLSPTKSSAKGYSTPKPG